MGRAVVGLVREDGFGDVGILGGEDGEGGQSNPASGDATRMHSTFDTFFPVPVSDEEKKDV